MAEKEQLPYMVVLAVAILLFTVIFFFLATLIVSGKRRAVFYHRTLYSVQKSLKKNQRKFPSPST